MITIDKSKLKPALQNLTEEEIISIINAVPTIKTTITRGRVAEQNLLNLLSENFTAELTGRPHAGDLLIYKKKNVHLKIMIESKDYTGTIPIDEYNKFLFDLKNNNYAGGIFVGSNKISGMSLDTLNIIDNHIILIENDPRIILFAAEFLWDYLSQPTLQLKNKLDKYLNEINNSLNSLYKSRQLMTTMKKKLKSYITEIEIENNKTIDSLTNIINKNSSSAIVQAINLYDYPLAENTRSQLLRLFEKHKTSKIIVQKENIIEFYFETGEFLNIEIMKTRTKLRFKPKKIMPDLNFSIADGMMILTLDAKDNFLDDLILLIF
jgi:hypothetical protein